MSQSQLLFPRRTAYDLRFGIQFAHLVFVDDFDRLLIQFVVVRYFVEKQGFEDFSLRFL